MNQINEPIFHAIQEKRVATYMSSSETLSVKMHPINSSISIRTCSSLMKRMKILKKLRHTTMLGMNLAKPIKDYKCKLKSKEGVSIKSLIITLNLI